MKAKVFSIPLNPKLNPKQLEQFAEFCKEYKDYIYDFYFTCRIEPFMQDAMGDVFMRQEDYTLAVDQALAIQQYSGVPASATFNNIQIPPTQKNLDTFIQNFKPIYDKGIRIATIPHTHWMATGQIKSAFPELFVKNTILRDVRVAAEIVNLAKYGFDYINLDRDLMRDRDTLVRLKQAKDWIKLNLGKDIHYSLLANEGCIGNCPMMVEHFEFNNTRVGDDPQYFNSAISRVSCPKWDAEDPSTDLKTANLPPWKEDWEEFITDLGINAFKMHGRENIPRLAETMEIVRRWARNEEILFDNFNSYLEATNLQEKPIDVWRKKIKNCKFDCWECQYCDKIYKVKSEIKHSALVKKVVGAIADSGVPKINIPIPGLTASRVQTLINSLVKDTKTYMEVGSSLGATFSAALHNNTVNGISIDLWEEQIQPKNKHIERLPENNKKTFEENIKPYIKDSSVEIIEQDLFKVNTEKYHNSVDVWFYDGPHEQHLTAKAVEHYFPTFAEEAVLIFDDANWMQVVEGARQGIKNTNAQVAFEKILLNDEEDKNAWWNGLYIVVIKKKQSKEVIVEL